LLAASALHWAGCAPYHLVFGVFVRDLGLPSSVTGDAMGLGVLAEVGALFAFPFIGRRLGTRPVFAIAFGATALRWALLSRLTTAFPIIALQLLHGATFGLFWAGAIRALGEIVPPSLRATGQAIFGAVVFAAGNGAGYALAGWGYDRLGGVPPVFLGAAMLEAVPLALVLWPRRA
jgi:PPP family 3-phenylpropionic acid transporter